jgi:uncharacterized membrane-anchored protein
MHTLLVTTLLTTNALVFGLLALLHLYWVLGGKWALANALPQHLTADYRPVFQPGRLLTCLVAGTLLIWLLLNILPWLPVNTFLNDTVRRYSLLVIGLLFGLRTIGDFRYVGLTKQIRETPFAVRDTNLYTPLCGALALSHLACFALLS